MSRKIKQIICCVFAIGAVASTVQPVSSAEPVKLAGESLPWKALTFGASGWLNKIDTRIEILTVDAAEAQASAVASDRGEPFEASGPALRRIEISTTIDPAIGTTVQLNKKYWFDSPQGGVLFGESRRTGQEEYFRRFRFTRQGAYRLRREPASSAEAPGPADRWSDVKTSFYPYDLQKWGCRRILEPSILIDAIGRENLSPAGPATDACVFHKRHLFKVSVRPAGIEAIEVNYTEVAGAKSHARTGPIRALRLTMTAEPLGDYRGEVEDFSFLGFKGEITLYLDPLARLPLMISGTIPTVGRARMMLRTCEFINGADRN